MDLFESGMVDFDSILGMNWLHSYHVSLDCRAQKVIFRLPSEPAIEWKGGSLAPRGKFISYLRP